VSEEGIGLCALWRKMSLPRSSSVSVSSWAELGELRRELGELGERLTRARDKRSSVAWRSLASGAHWPRGGAQLWASVAAMDHCWPLWQAGSQVHLGPSVGAGGNLGAVEGQISVGDFGAAIENSLQLLHAPPELRAGQECVCGGRPR